MQIEMAEYTGYILPGQKQTHVKNTLFNSGVITLYISGSISIFDLLFRRLRLYIQSKKWETLTLSSEAETAFFTNAVFSQCSFSPILFITLNPYFHENDAIVRSLVAGYYHCTRTIFFGYNSCRCR